MREWVSRVSLSLAVAGACAFFPQDGLAQSGVGQRGSRLQFSEPKSSELTNSLNSFTRRKEDLRRLEQDLLDSQAVAPKNSMEGEPPPRVPNPARQVLSTKRMREAIERRNNWMLDPDSTAFQMSPDRAGQKDELGLPGRGWRNGLESSTEDQFMGLSRPSRSLSRQSDDRQLDPGARSGKADEESVLPPGLREREQELQSLLKNDSYNNADNSSLNDKLTANTELLTRSPFAFSSFDTPVEPPRASESQKALMDEFRQIHGLPTTKLTIIEQFKQLGASTAPAAGALTPLPSVAPTLPRLGGDVQFGAIPSAASIPEIARPMAAPTVGPSLPQLQTTPRLAPPSPTFTAPKRPF